METPANQCQWCDKDTNIITFDGCCCMACLSAFYAWLGSLGKELDKTIGSVPSALIQFNILNDLDEW